MGATGPSSGMDTYSACAPNRHSWNPNTPSPTANDVTRLPTSSTVPANSVPRIALRGVRSPVKTRMKKG